MICRVSNSSVVFESFSIDLSASDFCQQDMNAFGPRAAWTGLLGKWKILNGIIEMH